MKAIIAILTCVVFTLTSRSQDLEKIKASENLFILIETKNKSSFVKYGGPLFKRKSSQKQEWDVTYVLSSQKKSESDLSFHYSQYINFDLADMGIFTQVFYFNKSFIKKNKDIIITEELIDKIGFQDFFKLISGGKQLFVIDKDEIKNNKIKLKQVIAIQEKEE
ncbi:MAG TPA: hypothetical protein VKZ97_10690 [Flavobacteriaceae bacterium]|nr:hypothetical protein [Flavobacteriaceae bacterium]